MRSGDAEIEGAADYEVVVAADALERVLVTAGSIRIASSGQRTIVSATHSWQRTATASIEVPVRPAPAAPPAPSTERLRRAPGPAPSPSPSSAPAPAPAPDLIAAAAADGSASPSPATARRFHDGWTLLRRGELAAAARELRAVGDGGGPLAADARYFEGVALMQLGDGAAAERALIAFLDRAPRSARRGRAAVLLAGSIARRGDLASARAWYRSALADPDPTVAAAARDGLAALGDSP